MEMFRMDHGRPEQASSSLWTLPLRMMQCADRERATALAGKLRLSSPPRLGLEACFSLPLECAPESTGADSGVGSSPEDESGCDHAGARRVLVAEDNLISSRMIKIFLEKMKFQPVCVENGVLALRALANEAFDLVLMDVQMPEMDGLTAAQRIREGAAGQANRDVPIIAMTAHVLGRDEACYLDAGMDGYAEKPVDLPSLSRLIEEVLAVRGCATRGAKLATAKTRTSRSAEVLDRERLLQRYRGDRTQVDELYQAFLGDGPVRVQGLRSARESGSLDDLARAAHSIKGMAGVVFADKAMKLAVDLQDAALAGHREFSESLAERLCAAMDEVFEELRQGAD